MSATPSNLTEWDMKLEETPTPQSSFRPVSHQFGLSSVFSLSPSQPVIPAKRPASAILQPALFTSKPYGSALGSTPDSGLMVGEQSVKGSTVVQNTAPVVSTAAATSIAIGNNSLLGLPTPSRVNANSGEIAKVLHTGHFGSSSSGSHKPQESQDARETSKSYSFAAVPAIDSNSHQAEPSALGSSTLESAWNRPALHLFEGPVLEIRVGSSYRRGDTQKTWYLSEGLVSHFSPFLADQCSASATERLQKPIELPYDDPRVFSLFVEWMLYGTYTMTTRLSMKATSHARAWILGDKLKVLDFQNLAMDRLYQQHNAMINQKPVTPKALKVACANTPADSLLRHFYCDMLVRHYANPEMFKGTTAELDAVLQEHADARTVLLESLRKDLAQRTFLKKKEEYMVKE